MGIDAWTAVRSASLAPAQVLGLDDIESGGYGRVEAGCLANIVLFDASMSVRCVILRGNSMKGF